MKPYWKSSDGEIYHGNVLDVLRALPDESVQMCVTSPPYWGLRDYGLEPQIWDGGKYFIMEMSGEMKLEKDCKHVWGDEKTIIQSNHTGLKNIADKCAPRKNPRSNNRGDDGGYSMESSQGQFCQKCNAWRGSLGLEPTPELFLAHMVQIFAEVKRILRKDGTCWINMGDGYTSGNRTHRRDADSKNIPAVQNFDRIPTPNGLKPKDLIGMPWRLAFALQADGWWLRSAMPWVKRSAMPESVTDRPASALEYMFLFAKSQKYYFDMDAIRKGYQQSSIERADNSQVTTSNTDRQVGFKRTLGSGRNFRNTDLFYESITPPHGTIFAGDEMVGIDVNPQAEKAAHFAAFPSKLVEPCILAGTSEKGCCPECGAPCVRVVEKGEKIIPHERLNTQPAEQRDTMDKGWNHERGFSPGTTYESKTTGWKTGCGCNKKPIPCTVLEPFLGSGKTFLVAYKHGRRCIGAELNKTYLDEIAIPKIEKARKQRKLF